MSLYGALFSGVSGLAAQSSAMGAISDNIANVNTTGYKGSKVNFNTLVTKQVSLTNYSPGGVQSKPRASIDVQGLLQATNSSTDMAMSGQGFFVVNEAAKPGDGDMFAYTRAGSFKVDKEGYLQNVSGWYMQGWPLMAWDNSLQASTVTVGNSTYMKGYKDELGNQVYVNDNIVSATHLRPLNLNEVGGTASQTRNLRMGANLPNSDVIGATHKQPVTMYDSLGGDATVQFNWKKVSQNNWDVDAIPPLGAKSLTLKNTNSAGNAGAVYGSMGRLDFLGLPKTTGAMTMNVGGTTWTLNTKSGTSGQISNNLYVDPSSVSVGSFVGSVASQMDRAMRVQMEGLTQTPVNTTTTAVATMATGTSLTLTNAAGTNFSYSLSGLDPAAASTLAIINADSALPAGHGITASWNAANRCYDFAAAAGTTTTAQGAGDLYNVPTALPAGATTSQATGSLDQYAAGSTITLDSTSPATTISVAGLSAQGAVNAINAVQATTGVSAFFNAGAISLYSTTQKTVNVTAAGDFAATFNATTLTATGRTYCEQLAGTNSLVFRQFDTTNDMTIAGLDSLDLTNGNSATMQGQDLTNSDTFVLAAAPDSALSAIVFNGDGTPNKINVGFIDIDWANGSTDMSGSDSIGLFLGNTGIRDGMTQLNGDYQLAYWNQNGAKFGNFAGVSIGSDGIVTALFDNGVTRPVFQIPVSTFVNPNGMQSLTGNVFISTDNSGEPTLRQAGSAGAGQVNSAALEASTVDIGEEFTTMIVTQRAYSAAAKIITTADQMLDELVQIKR